MSSNLDTPYERIKLVLIVSLVTVMSTITIIYALRIRVLESLYEGQNIEYARMLKIVDSLEKKASE